MTVIFGMFVVIMGATTAYVNRQFNRTVHDEAREAALYAAEAGLNYTTQALTEAWYKPNELLSKGSIGMPINIDPAAKSSVLVFFGKEPTLEESQGLRVVSNGLAFGGECRAIEAVIHRASNQNNVFKIAYQDILSKCSVPRCWVGVQGTRDHTEGPNGSVYYSWASSGTTSCSSDTDASVSGTSGSSTLAGSSSEVAVTCQCSLGGEVTDSIACIPGETACEQGSSVSLPPAPVPGSSDEPESNNSDQSEENGSNGTNPTPSSSSPPDPTPTSSDDGNASDDGDGGDSENEGNEASDDYVSPTPPGQPAPSSTPEPEQCSYQPSSCPAGTPPNSSCVSWECDSDMDSDDDDNGGDGGDDSGSFMCVADCELANADPVSGECIGGYQTTIYFEEVPTSGQVLAECQGQQLDTCRAYPVTEPCGDSSDDY